MADLVMQELPATEPKLKGYLKAMKHLMKHSLWGARKRAIPMAAVGLCWAVLLSVLSLAAVVPAARAAEAPKEALPLTVFKNLQAGKKQTVVVYGTSLTINGAWAKALQAYLDKQFPGQVTFVNSARSGMHSDWGVENLQERVLSKNPDLVFIEFAVNDAATKNNVPLEKSAANLDRMVKTLRAQNPQVDIVLQTMNPAWDSPTQEKKYGSDRPNLEAYYAVYRRYAREHDLPLVDNYPNWLKVQREEPQRYRKMVPDGIHPSSTASVAVTWPAVQALLEKARTVARTAKQATPLTVAVWPEGKMPERGAGEPETDLPARGDNTRRITNVSRPTLTVFPAPKKAAPAPAMIVCPGGGYSYVVFNKEGTEIAEWLNSAGITALVLKYRVPDNRAGAFRDIQRALRLARSRAGEWNIDPNRLGVIGFSAGGHLAARASTQFSQPAYPAIDAVDGLSSRPDFAVLVYPAYLGSEGKPAPELDMTAKIPPTLILHSEDDRSYVPGSKIYHAALDAAKVPHEFKLYPTGGHGYGLRSERDARAWPQYALDWLHKTGILPVAATPPAKETFHVYLLMGQSNMVGRDTRTLDSQKQNPRVLALNEKGEWVVAKDPLHAQVGRVAVGVGPGISFALEMLKADPKITVGLVPCAVGGTPLRRWVKGADLYEKAVSRARRAAQAGVLKGVLWHQGESDTEEKGNADTYETRLTQMFKALRQDLGLPDLPIVVGQLGDFLTPEKYPYVETVRAAIKHTLAVMPGVGYANSTGLGHKGDNLHFSADAEKELGARFARAMQQLQSRSGPGN